MNSTSVKRILRLPKVEDRTGLKQTQIYRLEVRGKFPRRIKISDRASGWLESEIDAWIEQRVIASRDQSATT
jgi:predicted DNA-binding transcriptional regulator AlpA